MRSLLLYMNAHCVLQLEEVVFIETWTRRSHLGNLPLGLSTEPRYINMWIVVLNCT
ncbi:hypothetical protein DPMN_166007 [Dreissena polymorpha]|uniref:Uncharacterized protein n=1 Tax=Dreissena polymorpha TaxID=45954 RepID=A0A9D4EY21_DREPO|nr:hypothetical protein DPMN_166007 [Dreissena polymorpha]